MPEQQKNNWTVDDSATLYGVRQWGQDLFDINAQGDLTVKISGADGEISTALIDIIHGIEQRGHNMPVLLRIENFLDTRIKLLHDTFYQAIDQANYQGTYQGVFPVKVNQQCQVIEEISRFGAPYNYGLEAGSKGELVLALANNRRGSLLILNGYKDRDFIDLGLWAQKLGQRCFFVIESLPELKLLLERSALLKIRPQIGARVKVAVKVSGMWTETSGDRSSFGLDSRELVTMVELLRQQNMLDCLQLLHCHLGSQIPSLADISAGVCAACHYYVSLVKEGAAMGYIDFGGGLAVDYSGNSSGEEHSRDYSLADYARTIVTNVMHTLDTHHIVHPHIITESGRATVAYSSMLIFDIIDVMHFGAIALPQQLDVDNSEVVRQLFAIHQDIDHTDPSATYANAQQLQQQLRQQFQHGSINLQQRALGEEIFLAIAQQIYHHQSSSAQGRLTPDELNALRESLADIYYGNFSVFQSLPDTWAIGQKFPIVPLQRHNQRPQQESIISDLTCDCDGKLASFIVNGAQRSTLPLHQLAAGEKYYLGVFLMGAYQETLGDIHNLFGDTNVVSIRLNTSGAYDIIQEQSGNSIGEVLQYVDYRPQALFESMRSCAETSVSNGEISIAERQQLLKTFSTMLSSYTYYRQ
ncbi:MAG: biosynthetic arginine decarboxylase [Desulfuromonas sp.]|nr:biosynthetic arginine decarboxylase [Desulfuromonas sp.]